MKKILVLFAVLFLLLGCSNKNESETIELNHDELMAGDFSSIAGEYESPSGRVITINDKGLQKGEKSVGEVTYWEGSYGAQRFPENSVDGGYAISIYPVGVEIYGGLGEGRILDTDTSKIRICHGQAGPMSEEEIYTKKEE